MSVCQSDSAFPKPPMGRPFSTTFEITVISLYSRVDTFPPGIAPIGAPSSSPNRPLNATSCGSSIVWSRISRTRCSIHASWISWMVPSSSGPPRSTSPISAPSASDNGCTVTPISLVLLFPSRHVRHPNIVHWHHSTSHGHRAVVPKNFPGVSRQQGTRQSGIPSRLSGQCMRKDGSASTHSQLFPDTFLLDHATSTSVWAKSSPLNSSGSPVTSASA